MNKVAATSSTLYPSNSTIHIARHLRSLLYGRGIASFMYLNTWVIKIHWSYPRLPHGIVACTFALFPDNLSRNSCICVQRFTYGDFVHCLLCWKNNTVWGLMPLTTEDIDGEFFHEWDSMTLTSFFLFLVVPGHILHWVFPCGDFNPCSEENTLLWWNLRDEGASCHVRLGKFYCPLVL